MITTLEAIHWELSTLRLRVECLEQAEAALSPLYERLEPPQDPKMAEQARSRTTPGLPTREEVREYVIANGPLARGEIVAALGGSPQAIDDKLKRLLAKGEIGADGRPGARRYRSPDKRSQITAAAIARLKVAPPRTLPDRGVYPVYDAIIDLNGATTEQLARHTGLPVQLVVEQGRRLLQLGLARFTGAGSERRWLATRPEIGDAA